MLSFAAFFSFSLAVSFWWDFLSHSMSLSPSLGIEMLGWLSTLVSYAVYGSRHFIPYLTSHWWHMCFKILTSVTRSLIILFWEIKAFLLCEKVQQNLNTLVFDILIWQPGKCLGVLLSAIFTWCFCFSNLFFKVLIFPILLRCVNVHLWKAD